MTAERKSQYVRNDPRPQRMCSWFTVISLTEFASIKTKQIPFLDTFVTIQQTGSDYTVFFEGVHEMVSFVKFGLIIAWHGNDLQNPESPAPELFTQSVGDGYHMSKK